MQPLEASLLENCGAWKGSNLRTNYFFIICILIFNKLSVVSYAFFSFLYTSCGRRQFYKCGHSASLGELPVSALRVEVEGEGGQLQLQVSQAGRVIPLLQNTILQQATGSCTVGQPGGPCDTPPTEYHITIGYRQLYSRSARRAV